MPLTIREVKNHLKKEASKHFNGNELKAILLLSEDNKFEKIFNLLQLSLDSNNNELEGLAEIIAVCIMLREEFVVERKE